MYSETIATLEKHAKALEEELQRRADKENWDYIDHLDHQDELAKLHYEEEQLVLFRRARRDGTSIDWHAAFEAKLEEHAQLKSFAVELYAGQAFPPFDVKELLEQWPNLPPLARAALAWLASQCTDFRVQAERRPSDRYHHPVGQEAPSSASPEI